MQARANKGLDYLGLHQALVRALTLSEWHEKQLQSFEYRNETD